MTSPKSETSLTGTQRADLLKSGFGIARADDIALQNAIYKACYRARIPYIGLLKRGRYCNLILDMDTVAFPIKLPSDNPIREMALSAIRELPVSRISKASVLHGDSLTVVNNIDFGVGKFLAVEVAAYLRSVDFTSQLTDRKDQYETGEIA